MPLGTVFTPSGSFIWWGPTAVADGAGEVGARQRIGRADDVGKSTQGSASAHASTEAASPSTSA